LPRLLFRFYSLYLDLHAVKGDLDAVRCAECLILLVQKLAVMAEMRQHEARCGLDEIASSHAFDRIQALSYVHVPKITLFTRTHRGIERNAVDLDAKRGQKS